MAYTLKKQGRRQEAGGRRQEGRGFGLFLPFIAGAPPVGRFQETRQEAEVFFFKKTII
ncbi:MAG: hypothetical protein F6K14_34175 [Symploca sp. SIO2C1]|nr:hypothetical protein [Symploca sp. SIO2C1]